MARLIYDYWFVQFDFPDANGKPYKSSGGKMVWNAQLKREIPEGWEMAPLTQFGTLKNGINYDKNEKGDKTVKIINVRNISDSEIFLNPSELDDITLKSEDIKKYITSSNDILLARSGTPGATRILPHCDNEIIYCGFVIRFSINENKKNMFFYLFNCLKRNEQIAIVKSAGSILKNISQDTLSDFRIAEPNFTVLEKFNKRIKPIYEKMAGLLEETNRLKNLRDFLLPLLMNGQVNVKRR